jgi:hypothetical protein
MSTKLPQMNLSTHKESSLKESREKGVMHDWVHRSKLSKERVSFFYLTVKKCSQNARKDSRLVRGWNKRASGGLRNVCDVIIVHVFRFSGCDLTRRGTHQAARTQWVSLTYHAYANEARLH